jgi:hypothetical protein
MDVLGISNLDDPIGVVDRVVSLAGGLEVSSDVRQALVDYAQSPLNYPQGFNGQPNPQQRQAATDARLRGLVLLALASTDYQVS